MKLIFNCHKSPPSDVKTLQTVVFVDYESLYFSFMNQYATQPELNVIINHIKSYGKITKIKVFGDFTNPVLNLERNRIRTITSDIIDCGHDSNLLKKDFTDFIMLDHIYQEVIQNQVAEQFILLTGDGHFSSVATFLRTYMDKTVGVFGVVGSVSRQLHDCSTWTTLVRAVDYDDMEYQKNLFRNLKTAQDKGLLPTFTKTIEHTVRYYGGDVYKYERILRNLIEDGYVKSELCTSFHNREFKILIVDWDRVEEEFAHA